MPTNASPQQYIAAVAPLAQAAMRDLGIPASVAIAQSADETGWGQSVLARRCYNYFGMKLGPDQPEPFWDGHACPANPAFRRYADPQQSFRDFAYGFYTYPGYALALQVRADPVAFVVAEAPIYSPDAGYASRILSILSAYDLVQYDLSPDKLVLSPLVPPAYRT